MSSDCEVNGDCVATGTGEAVGAAVKMGNGPGDAEVAGIGVTDVC